MFKAKIEQEQSDACIDSTERKQARPKVKGTKRVNSIINIKTETKMKKIALTLVALLTMTAAMAQQSDNKERRGPRKIDAQEMTDRMAKELSLDDKQKAKVLELNKEYQDVLGGPGMGRGPRGGRGGHRGQRPDSLKKTDGQTGATQQTPQAGERPQRPQLTEAQKAEFEKRQAEREEYNQKLNKILNGDQQKKYKEMQHRGGRGRGPRPHRN